MKKEIETKVAEFDIQDLLPIALTIVVAGIGIAYGLSVMSDVKSGFVANSAEANATDKAIEGVAGIANKLPLIVTVLIASVVIGILVRYLFVGGTGRR